MAVCGRGRVEGGVALEVAGGSWEGVTWERGKSGRGVVEGGARMYSVFQMARFDVAEHFRELLRGERNLKSTGVAAIETLMRCIEASEGYCSSNLPR